MSASDAKRPLVGITMYGRDADGKLSLPARYVDCVRRAGGVPVLLPPGEIDTGRWLEAIDAVIFAGGGDIAPELYGGQVHEAIYNVDVDRDRAEISLARQAADSGLPALGICRGVQVLNVALGGSLIEHLPDVVGEQVLHRLPPREPTAHRVDLEPGSRLAGILGQTELTAASWHHQAIRHAAPSLRVVGTAADGTVEAVEAPAHPWLFGVQWHPELTAADDAAQQRLFDAVVAAALDVLRSRR